MPPLLQQAAQPQRAGGAQPAEQPDRAGVQVVGQRAERGLLVAGIVSSILFAAMLVVVPLQWPSYSSAAHTVSELSAIGAPTRALWVALAMLWTALYLAFGWGVWRAARDNRALHVVGGAIIVAAIVGLFWPPMHQRDVLAAGGGTLTDTLHLVWTALNGILTLLAMGFGAAALGKPFRLYTIATMIILIAAGVLIAPLPGPGGIPVIVVGLMVVLKNSFKARRQFVRLHRAHPRVISPIRRLLRRDPEFVAMFYQQTLRVERLVLPRPARFVKPLRRKFRRR